FEGYECILLLLLRRTPFFPYTTLFRSPLPLDVPLSSLPQQVNPTAKYPPRPFSFRDCYALEAAYTSLLAREHTDDDAVSVQSSTDRKSTRLNSSHVKKSYAVFC